MPAITQSKFKEQKYIIPLFNVSQYSSFSNQPSDDAVEVISNSAGDTQKCTIWGTDSNGDYQYETITLDGTTAVETTRDDWDDILGVFLGDVSGENAVTATGTITVRTGTGGDTVTTISSSEFSSGNIRFLINGLNVFIHNKSGNTYVDMEEWAATNKSLELTDGMTLDTKVEKYLTFQSDSEGSVVQVVVWRD